MLRPIYSVMEMCKALKLSTSGYYAWKKHRPSLREQSNCLLLKEIRKINAHRHMACYGSPRMYRQLRSQGIICSEKRVARLMREHGIQGKYRRAFRPKTTQVDGNAKACPNHLARQSAPERPGQQLVSDITYVPTKQGWLYLTTVMDLFSRAIIGWDLSDSLAAQSLQKAVLRSSGQNSRDRGTIFHSDRGCQYTSKAIRKEIQQLGWTQSMSAKGYCYDNAFAESFFASFKTEALPLSNVFETKQQARMAVFDYIEAFYNNYRLHSSLNYKSPAQVLKLYFNKQKIQNN